MADFNSLRQDYRNGELDESHVHRDPMQQFATWFGEAVQSGLREPNAMTLASANAEGEPSARIVLLKGFDAAAFTFYTNYESQKGQDLAANPRAALVFFWVDLERQIRIKGDVEKVPRTESEEYFHVRPLKSRFGALVSAQSSVIASRGVLVQRLQELERQYGDAPPCPEFWGGYRLRPVEFEFWQGRRSRLHDRIRYRREADGSWSIARLSP